MNYHAHFRRNGRTVEVCLLGTGGFGRSLLAQGRAIPGLSVRVAVDVRRNRGRSHAEGRCPGDRDPHLHDRGGGPARLSMFPPRANSWGCAENRTAFSFRSANPPEAG